MFAKTLFPSAKTQNKSIATAILRYSLPAALIIVQFCLVHSIGYSALVNSTNFRSGIQNGRGACRLTADQLQIVARSLQMKTGFSDIYFDQSGSLQIAGARRGYGSPTAQALLLDAFRGSQLIELCRRDRSPNVAFARIVASDVFENGRTGRVFNVYRLEIDFDDFNHIKGQREAKQSFDLGFILLHEMAHGIKGIYDTNASRNSAGDCANYINYIRTELSLPVRAHYHPDVRRQTTSAGTRYMASLNFSGGSRNYSLYWDSARVGNIQ